MEIFHAFFQRGEESGQRTRIAIGSTGELVGPRVKEFRLVNAPCLVWAKCRVNLGVDSKRGGGLVLVEAFGGVVRGA